MKISWKYVDGYLEEILKKHKHTRIIIIATILVFFGFLDSSDVLSRFLYDWYVAIFTSHPIFFYACVVLIIIEAISFCKLAWKVLSATLDYAADQYFYILIFLLTSIISIFLWRIGCPLGLVCVLIAAGVLFNKAVLSRIERYRVVQEQSDQSKTTFYDLGDIFGNHIKWVNADGPILLSDKAVKYDLLERDHIVNAVLDVIKNSRPQSSFVIGLEGEWGSGKSTIVENTKYKLKESGGLEHIIISSFDPWLYNDNETFLLGMFDAILKDTGIDYSFLQMRRAITVISELLSKNGDTSYFTMLLNPPLNLSEKLQDIKRMINLYLEANDKVIVLFIDEIDRAMPENVLFLFKILSVILDLNKIIYVLSYDPVQISKVEPDAQEHDYEFLEKIVQMKIKVDVPSPSVRRVCLTCFRNILTAYGETSYDYEASISCICSSIRNLREFKRFINSALYTVISQGGDLYKPHLLALEYIKYGNYNLYHELYDNRQFLISRDIKVRIDMLAASGITYKKDSEEDRRNFIKRVSEDSKNKPFSDILSYLFPCALSGKMELAPEEYDKEVEKSALIISAKYFELYFTYGTNEYITIKKDVEEFIKGINGNTDAVEVSREFEKKIKELSPYDQMIWMDSFCLLTKDLSNDKTLLFAKMLFNSVYWLKEDLDRWRTSPQIKAVSYIIELLTQLDNNSLDEFMRQAAQSYSRVRWIGLIAGALGALGREAPLKCYEYMCLSIVNEKVNLYAKENYHYYNFEGMLSFYYHKNALDVLREYLFNLVSEKNVYRVLGDFIACHLGKTYGYYISPKACSLLSTDNQQLDLASKLDSIIDKHPPTTESERHVYKVYKYYRDKKESKEEGPYAEVLSHMFHYNL